MVKNLSLRLAWLSGHYEEFRISVVEMRNSLFYAVRVRVDGGSLRALAALDSCVW